MPNTLKIKRGTAATIPQGQIAEPLFTTDTYDLYIGKGSGGNQRIQNYIASGTSSQFLKGDGSLDSTTYQATSEKGQNNGYASLDAGGKIPAAQLPSSVIEYKGTWNASTNTPTLADGTGDAGDVYIVSVGGTQNLGSGSITFDAGDWVMYNGSVWQKSTGSNAVASVNGQTGIVVLDTDDISEPVSATNLWFTNARARTAISLTTTGSSGMATYDNMTGVLNVPNYSISGLGGVPTSRQLTINGTAYDLSADRSWSVGTVTSVAALTIGTTGTDITSTVATGTTTPVITLNIPTASATNRGALSSADWSTFNGKQAQLNGTGFVKVNGTTISYDNTSYLSLAGGTMTGQIVLAAGTTSTDYTKGIRFPNDPYGGGGDTSGLRLYADTGIGAEAQVLELYVTNDGAGGSQDRINFSAPSNNLVTINGNSIALNSSLSNYLPLTGGTLTGALIGTSASFDSTISLTKNLNSATAISITNTNAGSSALAELTINTDSSGFASFGKSSSTRDGDKIIDVGDTYIFSNGIGNICILNNFSTGSIRLAAGGSSTAHLTIASSGASTFSSNVTATAFIPTGSTVPTNGMYLSAANTLGLSANSTKVIEISDSGRVSIGATSPTTDTLTVHGRLTTTNGGDITAGGQISSGSTISSGLNIIAVNTISGSALIPTGTTAPTVGMYLVSGTSTLNGVLGFSTNSTKRLEINNSTGAATFSSSVTSNGGNIISTYSSNTTTGNAFPRIGASNTNATQQDYNISELFVSAGNGTVYGGLVASYSSSFPTSTPSIMLRNSGDGPLYFSTNGSIKQTITSGGDVLIGATSGSFDTGSGMRIERSGQSTIRLVGQSSGGEWTMGSAGMQFDARVGYIRFITGANSGSAIERMRITDGGAVQATNNLTANSPSGGNTGEGIIAGRSFKIDASGTGQRAAMYVVSQTLSNTYGSGLQIQFANLADTLGFGFNLTTGGTYETYIKDSSANWQRRMSITQSGDLLLGKSSVDWTTVGLQTENNGKMLGVTADGSANNIFLRKNNATGIMIQFWYNSTDVGSITMNTTNTTYNTGASDLNLKKNFEKWDENILSSFIKINPIKFNYKFQNDDEQKIKGFIAQEMIDKFPEAYPINEKGFYSFNPSGMVVYLMKAIQEQQAQLEELKSKLA